MKPAWIVLIIIFILALQAALRLPGLNEPLERDEGCYAYIAQRLPVGELPYRDYFEIKPPGIYYIYAGAFRVFGESPRSLRLASMLFGWLTTILVFLIGKKLWGDRAGLLSALIYAIFSSGAYIHGASANTEPFMVLFTTLAFWLVLGKRTGRFVFLAGLACGVAFMIKQVAVFNFAALIVLLLLDKKSRQLPALAAGFLVPPALGALYFAWQGALGPYINFVYIESLLSFQNRGLELDRLAMVLVRENALLWLLGLIGSLAIIKKERKPENLWLLVWALFSLGGTLSAGAFYGHYFIQSIPPLALLSAYTVLNFKKIFPARLAAFTTLGFMAGLTGLMVFHQLTIYTSSPDRISELKYNNRYFVISPRLAAAVAARSTPADTILVWGAEPEIYFYSRRKAASRFIYYYPLIYKSRAVDRYTAEFLADLERNRPKFIIWLYHDIMFPELYKFLTDHYRYFATVEGRQIWQRK